MTVRWLLLGASALPDTDDWLGQDEKKILSGLNFPKRRAEWKLGRYTAKRALSSYTSVEQLSRIEIIAAKDGAPEAFVDGRSMDCAISISHREDVAACVVAERGEVGCDLEAIEPRTTRFVHDFFTERERIEVERASDELRDLRVALTWSAKESTLKALRVGLRRDTRSVEIQLADLTAPGPAWRGLRATLRPEGRAYRGWWRRIDGLVLSVLGDEVGALEARPERLPTL
jgi:4'-phosphopantetheinyl transferase